MNYCVIDGISYDVIVESITEECNQLYTEKTGRTIAPGAPMLLDSLGSFIGHVVTFVPTDRNAYDALWDFLKTPRNEGFRVSVADNQSTIAYEAYCSSVRRKVNHIGRDGSVHWYGMEAHFIPMEAQETV